jgi:hypothetical protein
MLRSDKIAYKLGDWRLLEVHMTRRSQFVLLAATACLAASGCPHAADHSQPNVQTFNDELLRAAAEYKSWDVVDHNTRVSPLDCRAPDPLTPHLSASADTDTHGQKLYLLFARKTEEYLDRGGQKAASAGQVIVKESWVAEEVARDKADLMSARNRKELVLKDGTWYRPARQADLFIMAKFDRATPGTDDGWVYGTVTSDGKTVTSAGKIESCIKCHQDGTVDRLFGLKASK